MEGLPVGGVASRGLQAPAGDLHVPSPLPQQQVPASICGSVWGLGCCPSLGQRKLLCGLCWRLCSRRTESTSFARIPGAVLCILGHDTKQVQNHRKPCLDCVWRPDLLAELRQEWRLEPGSQRSTGQSAGCRGSGPARGLHRLRP